MRFLPVLQDEAAQAAPFHGGFKKHCSICAREWFRLTAAVTLARGQVRLASTVRYVDVQLPKLSRRQARQDNGRCSCSDGFQLDRRVPQTDSESQFGVAINGKTGACGDGPALWAIA